MKKTRHRKYSYMGNFLLVILFMVCIQAIRTTYDNDLWWILATGREILNRGFPKFNPWTVYSDMHIVIQQWIPCVITYYFFSIGGLPALEILLSIQIVFLFIVLWKLCSYCADQSESWLCVFIVIAFISLSTYFSSRPQIYTMIFYSILIYVLEKYKNTNAKKYLFEIPIITLVHVNFHASMAPFDLFIIALYVFCDFKCSIFEIRDIKNELIGAYYHRRALLVTWVASGIIMLLNPYGAKNLFYLLESMGAAGYGNYISEMGAVNIYSAYGIADLILIIIVSISIGKNYKSIDLPLTILFYVSAFLSIMHVRNNWLVALFSLPLISKQFKNISFPHICIKAIDNRAIYLSVTILTTIFLLLYAYTYISPSITDFRTLQISDSATIPRIACDWLENYINKKDISKNHLSIYNDFNCGGYLEYRGFKVSMDPRPELWEPEITGISEHYYEEYVDLQSGNIDPGEYLKKHDFDFLLVKEGSILENYLQKNYKQYQITMSCNGYKLWNKRSIMVKETT